MDGLYHQSPPYLNQQQMYRPHSIDHHHDLNWSSNNYNNPTLPRPKITTNVWEDEGTLCFQVDAKGICVARRQDNDMINGTKLLNVVGMSRGKRDGILKNEKGRVVVKVGAMHLKGVWIPFNRATELAEKFKILDVLYPLFVDEPSIYLCSSISASHNNDVIPSPPTNKCNIASPLPAYRSTNDDYSTNWEPRPYNIPNHYDHDDNMYLLNNDYYNQRQMNRDSFSSVSSHHSYLYPSYQEEENKPGFIDNNNLYNNSYTRSVYTASSPYIKSSPYTNNIHIDHTNKSAGSATPSSWLSPETPTAVLFQQKDKNIQLVSKKRKASCDSGDAKSKLSPSIRATRKIRLGTQE
ncbi:hypothetical protein INT48_009468 [Thamnidium elegans]|uniref:HTH APSES-type domain-containing protein n=1 Tax=Thamnidium elegans TaxID=101142 RepID=A0A8H7SIV7_9FUNG|nr:hypothetical protein INT48_009468 [Thamnidium elegans]